MKDYLYIKIRAILGSSFIFFALSLDYIGMDSA